MADVGMAAAAVGVELQHEIEQFLYEEAALLDSRRFDEWFELLSDDIRYWMPVRETRSLREVRGEVRGPDEIAYFDDDKTAMSHRIRRLASGMAWAEDPPSRTRHIVTNVRVRPRGHDEYEVACNLVVYRTRMERDVDWFVGERTDLLRRTPSGWQIARRTIVLDQTVLTARNLSIFF